MSDEAERFGPGARRLAGLTARRLGWHPHEFWSATPAELAAILAPADAPGSVNRTHLLQMMEHDNAKQRGR